MGPCRSRHRSKEARHVRHDQYRRKTRRRCDRTDRRGAVALGRTDGPRRRRPDASAARRAKTLRLVRGLRTGGDRPVLRRQARSPRLPGALRRPWGEQRHCAACHPGRPERSRTRDGRSGRSQATAVCRGARMLRCARADRADLQRRPERSVRRPCCGERSGRRSVGQPQVCGRPSCRQHEADRNSRAQRLRCCVGRGRHLSQAGSLSLSRRQA